MKTAFDLITSRLGLLAILAVALLTFHVIDKRSAVSNATEGYVKTVEVATVRAELAELKRRNDITEKANVALFDAKKSAELNVRVFEKELQDYEAEVHLNPACVVTDDLLGRLQ